MDVSEHDKSVILSLSLSGQKSANIFVDQTPTPTRLIKNCDEVGLFEDLRHVNPFEETFRLAVEKKSDKAETRTNNTTIQQHDENSLHTPQVYPQLEPTEEDRCFRDCQTLQKSYEKSTSMEDLLTEIDSYKVTSRQNSGCHLSTQKSCNIAEKPQPQQTALIGSSLPYMQLPASIQLIQPQLITLNFSAKPDLPNCRNLATAIPVQTVKPFILPKIAPATPSSVVSTKQIDLNLRTTRPSTILHLHEPSSASLTPTSQLPIKERLKAILSHSSKSSRIEQAEKTPKRLTCDGHERKRAAATRYRNKMRSEHKDLRQRNSELQSDNEKLRNRIEELELELERHKTNSLQQPLLNQGYENSFTVPQLQIPSSTVHLVMNIPKMTIPAAGMQPVLHHPITYSFEKK